MRSDSPRPLRCAACAPPEYGIVVVLCLAVVGCGDAPQSPPATAEIEAAATSPEPAAVERTGPLSLSTEFFPIANAPGLMRYPLIRELGRQALLIAARDELGLSTRDETLGEKIPPADDPAREPLALFVRAMNQGNGKLTVVTLVDAQRNAGMEAELGRFEFQFQSDTFNMYASLAEVLGAATRGQLPELLRQAGYSGTKHAFNENAPMPEGVDALLAKMDFVAQYDAVRRLHAAIDEGGESPARLGGLVRGYANLALLTRHHWNSAETAFAARALLYAERMTAATNASLLALQHRAYARALVGLHGIALQDLECLPPSTDAPTKESTAAWTEVVAPYCRFDDEALLALAQRPRLDELVPLLTFDSQSQYCDPGTTTDVGLASIKNCPNAYVIYARLSDEAPMLIQRRAVQMAAQSFGRFLPLQVSHVSGLPEQAAQLVREVRRPDDSVVSQLATGEQQRKVFSPLPMQVARSLRESVDRHGDSGEPSWQALAQMIAEEQFIEATNFLEVSQIAVEHSSEPLVQALLPNVEDHPYAPYIASFTLHRNRQPVEVQQLVSTIRVRDPRGRMQRLLRMSPQATDANGMTYHALGGEMLWQSDYLQPALGETLATVHPSWWQAPNLIGGFRRLLEDLRAISPSAPQVLRLEMSVTKDPTVAQLANWEKRGQDDPLALRQIGQLWVDSKEYESAIRCFERAYGLSRQHDTAISLATAYRSAGQPEKWLPTLERHLQQEDFALGHSVIQRHIAEDYILHGEWRQAEPYALASANTWSTMGLLTASRVYEGLGDWEKSEYWMHEAVSNYPSYHGLQWYLWCRRTGRGNLDEASRYAQQYLQTPWIKTEQRGAEYLFLDEMLDEKYDEALARLQNSPGFAGDAYWQMHVVLLAKRLKQADVLEHARRGLLQLADAANQELKPDYRDVIQQVFGDDAEESLSDESLDELEGRIATFEPIARSNYRYFLGELLSLSGNQERAEKLWRAAVTGGPFDHYNVTLAGDRLAKRHGISRPNAAKQDAVPAADDTVDQGGEAEAAKNSL